MRYTTEREARACRVNLDAVGDIDKTGSVQGMQKLYGWKRGGQVRIGGYIYNIGPAEVQRLRELGKIRGER